MDSSYGINQPCLIVGGLSRRRRLPHGAWNPQGRIERAGPAENSLAGLVTGPPMDGAGAWLGPGFGPTLGNVRSGYLRAHDQGILASNTEISLSPPLSFPLRGPFTSAIMLKLNHPLHRRETTCGVHGSKWPPVEITSMDIKPGTRRKSALEIVHRKFGKNTGIHQRPGAPGSVYRRRNT